MPKDLDNNVQDTEEVKQNAVNQSEEVKSEDAEISTSADANEGNNSDDGKVNRNRVVEKLQNRLTKEQADKNEYKDKYEAAKKKLEEFENSKSVKDLHEKNKTQAALDEKDKQIKSLQAQIKRSETLKAVDGIFKDANLSVSDDVLNLVVSDDNEKTVSNAQAIIDLVNDSYEKGRQTILKGKTPKAGSAKPVKALNTNSKRMSLLDMARLNKEDPEGYSSIFGQKG